MLRKRLIAAILLITPMLALIWLDVNWNQGLPGLWLLPTALLLSIVIAGELNSMLKGPTPGPISGLVYLGIVLVHLGMVAPHIPGSPVDGVSEWTLVNLAIFVTFLAAFLHEMWCYEPERPAIVHIALTIFATLYAGWLMAYLCAVRLTLENAEGALAILSILFIIKMSDAGAYFVGKKLGKHKLAPVLSPGKTIEGFFGGLGAAILAGFLVLNGVRSLVISGDVPPWWAILGYSVSLLLMGVAGDLAESLIKRNMGCKDSSGWLPGLGGIMDTVDSVLLAAPVAYLWWISGWL